MRELKYRGKSLHTNEWIYGTPVFKGDKAFIENDNGTFDEVSVDTMGEYAGIKDKNGKPVYEGDIFTPDSKYEDESGIVYFDEDKVKNTNNAHGLCLNWYINDDCLKKYLKWSDHKMILDGEITGNIYR